MDGEDIFKGAYALADAKTKRFMEQIAPYMFAPDFEALLDRAVANMGPIDDVEAWAQRLAADVADLTD